MTRDDITMILMPKKKWKQKIYLIFHPINNLWTWIRRVYGKNIVTEDVRHAAARLLQCFALRRIAGMEIK